MIENTENTAFFAEFVTVLIQKWVREIHGRLVPLRHTASGRSFDLVTKQLQGRIGPDHLLFLTAQHARSFAPRFGAS